MAFCNDVTQALDVLARHNLTINLSNRDWDRYIDKSSGPTLRAVGEALQFVSQHLRDRRLERFAKEAMSIALIECRK